MSAQRGRRNRQRGQEGEREVCAILTDSWGTPIKRQLGQARDGGTDVLHDPFAFEVKRRKRIAGLYEWLEQAQDAAKNKGLEYGMIAMRSDNNGWLVCMQMADFLKLAREEVSKGGGK